MIQEVFNLFCLWFNLIYFCCKLNKKVIYCQAQKSKPSCQGVVPFQERTIYVKGQRLVQPEPTIHCQAFAFFFYFRCPLLTKAKWSSKQLQSDIYLTRLAYVCGICTLWCFPQTDYQLDRNIKSGVLSKREQYDFNTFLVWIRNRTTYQRQRLL